ncbi:MULTISPECIES: hypothetical protein [unclassified Endozoicomonas]|uniref:hypothetical protein n=1 Tax=unclassified Endozoicomonas TaxID=2644528 RepID=UPI003BB17060
MDRLLQPSFDYGVTPSASTVGTDDKVENAPANQGKLSGRTVSPVSSEPVGANCPDLTADHITGPKDQKEIGISSRVVALTVDTVATNKPEFDPARPTEPAHPKFVAPLQPVDETLMPVTRLPVSREHPEQSPDEHQMTAPVPGVVKTGAEKSPAKFQENDIILLYPQNSVSPSGFDLHVNPGKLKDALTSHVHNRLVFLYDHNRRDDWPAKDEVKSLADSILTRLPTALYEFLNKDWSGRDSFAPEEYQALVKFHGAFIFFGKYDYLKGVFYEEKGTEYPTFNPDEKYSELKKLLLKDCLPLRNGWSEDERVIIEEWLNIELTNCQDYPDWEEIVTYIDYCHYGPLKADCVSVCNDPCYCVLENRAAYNRIKNLESQLEELQ